MELKEEGNIYFKAKDYKKALSKYALVQAYTRCVIPNLNEESSALVGKVRSITCSELSLGSSRYPRSD
jgi:hypothetical protein